MNKEQEENIVDYFRDIKKFVREGDYSSAQIMVSGLRKYIAEIKRDAVQKGDEQ